MAVRGITFNKQLLKSEDFAHQTNYFYQGKMGVTKGCEISVDVDGNLVVADGYFIIHGRQVANVGNTVVSVPAVASGTLYSKLVFTIDLTLENSITEFYQGYFEIISNSVTYPVLTQENLDNGGTKYQLEFYKFENTVAGITNGVDTRTILDLSMYALGEDLGNVDNLKTTAKTVVAAINEQNDNLSNIIERGSNINGEYIKFSDGTMVCTLYQTYNNISITTAWGALFTSSTLTWNFPEMFLTGTRPVVSLTNNNTSSFAFGVFTLTENTKTTFVLASAVSREAANRVHSLMAIGRWK